MRASDFIVISVGISFLTFSVFTSTSLCKWKTLASKPFMALKHFHVLLNDYISWRLVGYRLSSLGKKKCFQFKLNVEGGSILDINSMRLRQLQINTNRKVMNLS